MKSFPFLLIYSRILIAILIALLAFFESTYSSLWIVILMVVALLTDVFDGIIARKMNISTEKLRIWDSNVDQFFWLVTIASIFYMNFIFVKGQAVWLSLIFILELLCYLFSYFKFKKTIATHSILAKLWTLSLLVFLIDLVLHDESKLPYVICISLGVFSRVEIILIILGLKKWATDIPSILSVSKINKGIPIKKSKLFNS